MGADREAIRGLHRALRLQRGYHRPRDRNYSSAIGSSVRRGRCGRGRPRMRDVAEYHVIVANLEPSDVASLWSAALFGRRVEPALGDRLRTLTELRDRMGRAAAVHRSLQPR